MISAATHAFNGVARVPAAHEERRGSAVERGAAQAVASWKASFGASGSRSILRRAWSISASRALSRGAVDTGRAGRSGGGHLRRDQMRLTAWMLIDAFGDFGDKDLDDRHVDEHEPWSVTD